MPATKLQGALRVWAVRRLSEPHPSSPSAVSEALGFRPDWQLVRNSPGELHLEKVPFVSVLSQCDGAVPPGYHDSVIRKA